MKIATLYIGRQLSQFDNSVCLINVIKKTKGSHTNTCHKQTYLPILEIARSLKTTLFHCQIKDNSVFFRRIIFTPNPIRSSRDL